MEAENNEKWPAARKASTSQIDIRLIDMTNIIYFEVPTGVSNYRESHSFPTRIFALTLINEEKYKTGRLNWTQMWVY